MIDLPPVPTFCEAQMHFAKAVMIKVNEAKTEEVKLTYAAYSGDNGMKVLKKALKNYVQDNPLTPDEFSIKIYNECM